MRLVFARVLVLSVTLALTASCARSVASMGESGIQPNEPSDAELRDFGSYLKTVNRIAAGNDERRTSEREAITRDHPELASLLEYVEATPADLSAKQELVAELIEQEHYWNAYEFLREMEWNSPERWDVAVGLATVWDAWGETDLALEYAEKAVASRRSGETLALLGRIRLHKGDFQGAEAAFLAALESDDSDPVLLSNLGFALMSQKRWEEADARFRNALELRPDLVETRNNLAIVRAQLGDYDGAFDELSRVSSPAVAWNNLGTLYVQTDRLQDAQRAFLRSVELEPGYERAARNLAGVRSLLPPPSVVYLSSRNPDTSGVEDVPTPEIGSVESTESGIQTPLDPLPGVSESAPNRASIAQRVEQIIPETAMADAPSAASPVSEPQAAPVVSEAAAPRTLAEDAYSTADKGRIEEPAQSDASIETVASRPGEGVTESAAPSREPDARSPGAWITPDLKTAVDDQSYYLAVAVILFLATGMGIQRQRRNRETS